MGNHSHPFTDIPQGSAYTQLNKYIGWAYYNGYTDGISPTLFGYNQYMTRQDFMTIMDRYRGSDITNIDNISSSNISDYSSIASYARSAVITCAGGRLIHEDHISPFYPTNNITRGDVAYALASLMEIHLQMSI